MFTPANKRDRTKYCEFHEDHDHDTNDCIDLRKEIEGCIWKGRLAHLEKGAKTNDYNKHNRPSGFKNPQEDWSRNTGSALKPRNEIQMVQIISAKPKSSRIPFPTITFSEDDPIPENCSGDDPLIITADVGATRIHRVYVDGGSSAEIMYEHCFEQLSSEEKKTMLPPTTPLSGFAGQLSWPVGQITLPVTIYDYRTVIMVDFMIVWDPSPYNIILGRPGLRKLGAIPSTLHSLMKFQTQKGIAIIRGERLRPSICNQVSRKRDHPEETNKAKNIEHVIINDEHREQKLAIAANLSKVLKNELQELLQVQQGYVCMDTRGYDRHPTRVGITQT